MKKPAIFKTTFCILLFFGIFSSYGQNLKPFTIRFDRDLKGDHLLIGNNILSESDKNPFNDFKKDNSIVKMAYVDIDTDATTFSSSSATLVVPNTDATSGGCYKIVYAALYWAAITREGDTLFDKTKINKIKFKTPTGGYNDVTGEIIYDAISGTGGAISNNNSKPYACYADVTSLLQASNANGTYTVANVLSSVGFNGGTGLSAGWSLYIVYEDPKLPAKSITSFDGFSGISAALPPSPPVTLDIPVKGFRTIPSGPVRATFAFAALEGDRPLIGDFLKINTVSMNASDAAGGTLRSATNFFNSTVTYIDPVTKATANFVNRNPASVNTLGYDAGIINIKNDANSLIANGADEATITLGSNQDFYMYYFNAIALDIIEPDIVLTKIVKDKDNNNIGGANVKLGDFLFYEIGFNNRGNDAADKFTIKDVLPINILFDPKDIQIPTGSGITFNYDAPTRTIVFTIPNDLVEINDPRYLINFKVQVVPNCNDLSDACSDKIQNQAFATYRGIDNKTLITDDPSLSSFNNCFIGSPSPTNFLVGVDNCKFTKKYQLCGPTVTIRAADSYTSYAWSLSPFVKGVPTVPIISTNQEITVSEPGKYYVFNTAAAPCLSIEQEITVERYGSTVQNPVNPFADEVITCPNDGKDLPNIYLCGAGDNRLIRSGVTDTTDIVWQKSRCSLLPGTICADDGKLTACIWDNVATGPDFTASQDGQYRVVLNYVGGCLNTYYFNVYQNVLNPTVTSRDIICSTKGEIVVGGVPSTGYEFNLSPTTSSLNPTGSFQASNVFSVTTPGNYTVYIRQTIATPKPCLFSVRGIQIRQRNFTVSTFVTNPLCYGGKGSVKIAANDVRDQYYYEILNPSGISIQDIGPISDADYTFTNLSPGTYTIRVRTDDLCSYTGTVQITAPNLLTAVANITKPITCQNGQITVIPKGGTAPYFYFVNTEPTSQTSPDIDVSSPGGIYNIRVLDNNNCEYIIPPVTITSNPKPVYTIAKTDILCYGNRGRIQFNVTNTNGYALRYSINNGLTYQNSPVFSNLIAGTYTPIVRYTLGGITCFDPQPAIIITEPAAVTAAMGVSELAGCGPNREGKVQITNPQGGVPGVPPYKYSFDDKVTWITTNNAYKAPGTYTLYVRDKNECTFSGSVTIDAEPAEPKVTMDVTYNCDGTAIVTSNITNLTIPSKYTYDYYLDGLKNTNVPNDVFTNVSAGPHTVTVEYRLKDLPTFSNLLTENFGYGNDTTSPGINTAWYCFEPQVRIGGVEICKKGTVPDTDIRIDDGQYSVTSKILNRFITWIDPVDHTPPTTPTPTPKGRFLVVNIGDKIPKSASLYEKVINDLTPNQPIMVEFYAINLLKKSSTQFNPNLRIALLDVSGNEISRDSTSSIPKSEKWEKYSKILNPGANTSLKFAIYSNVDLIKAKLGNDVAIDDIKVYQIPKSCVTTKDFNIAVAGKAFDAKITNTNVTCSGLTDGQITIATQNFDTTKGFQYSIDNGATWSTSLTSPVPIVNLPAAIYTVLVRPDASSLACTKSFPVTITEPTPVTVTASITKTATCNSGATIAAVGNGGTPTYEYELRQADGITVVTAFNKNAIFTNVPAGNYTVFALDIKGCTSTGVAQSVIQDPLPTLTVNSDQCTSTGSSFTITATGAGIAPLTYNINSSAFQSSPTFAVTSGATGTSYTVSIKDGNGCIVAAAPITILPKLTLTAVLDKDITCNPAPTAAQVTLNPTGGSGVFTYEYKESAGSYTAMLTNVFTTSLAVIYTFRITDTTTTCTTVTTAPTSITTPENPEITAITQTQFINCSGDNTAAIAITLNTTKGQSPFVFTVQRTAPTAFNYGTQTSGLSAGDYTITVTDAKGCTNTKTITITEPAPIDFNLTNIDITCSALGGTTLGSITVSNVTGGTAASATPFRYFITNNFGDVIAGNPYTASATGREDHTFSIINFGIYTINVIDANGCSLSKQVTMASPPSDLTIDVTTLSSDCINGGTAIVKAISAVGSGNYEFGILETNISPYTSSYSPSDVGFPDTKTFINLTPGVTYTFVVHDLTTGCYYVKSASQPILSASPLTATVVPSNVTCKGSNDGKVTFTIDNFDATTTSVDYQVFTKFTNIAVGPSFNLPVTFGTPATVSNFSPLAGTFAPGSYYIRFIENGTGAFNNCKSASPSFDIKESSIDLSVTATVIKNANCTDLGIITAQAKDGTAPYRYQVTTSATAPLANDTNWVSGNTFTRAGSLAGIVYYVYAKDAYGCIKMDTKTVVQDPAPSVIVPAPATFCYDGNTPFIINLSTFFSATILPVTYSVNGSAFQSIPSFSFNAPDTYNLTVKDNNGCTTNTTYLVRNPLTVIATLIQDLTCPNPASITLAASGGDATYTYEVAVNGGSFTSIPSTSYTTNTAGTYKFRVKDGQRCPAESKDVIVTTTTTPTATQLPTNVSCNAGTDGTISITPANGVAPYTFALTGIGANTSGDISGIYSGLIAGTYSLIVTDDKGCPSVAYSIGITEPAPIIVPPPAVVQFGCTSENFNNLATITVGGVTGGSLPYLNYEFIKVGLIKPVQFSSNTTYTEFNLSGGSSYTVTVYDNKGCTRTTTATTVIDPYVALDKVNVAITRPISCIYGEDIAVTAAMIGGTATNLEYSLVDVNAAGVQGILYPKQTNATGIFTNLPEANYIVAITNLDTNCEIQSAHYVYNPNIFKLTIDNVVDVRCFGEANGSANVTIIDTDVTATSPDQAGPFTYTITGPVPSSGTATTAGPLALTGLLAGTYTVTATLTNLPFCTVTKNFTIAGPAEGIAISETHTAITCVSGNNDGTISATAIGGSLGGVYEFQLENTTIIPPTIVTSWSEVSDFVNLTAGTYTVKVRDFNGCEDAIVVVLNNPAPIAFTATPSTVLLACKDDTNASITASIPTGGQGSNYTYTLNTISASPVTTSGPQSGNVFANLGAGTYTVTVTDGWSCSTTSAAITIAEPPLVTASLVVSRTQTCTTQTQLTLTASGGTAPYRYSTTSTFITSDPMVGNTAILTVPVGTYRYYVRDVNGCTSIVSNDIVINPLPPLALTIDTLNAKINCKGDRNGVIVATAKGGLGNYLYTLLDSSGGVLSFTPVQTTPGNFTQLPAGTYRVNVESQDCTLLSTQTILITEPANALIASAVVTPVTCNGQNNGIITVTASGGTGIIKYAIEPRLDQFFNTGIFEKLQPKSYQIIVQDQNGCYLILNETVTEPLPLFVRTIAGSEVQEICEGDKNAAFDIDVTGGVAPYTVTVTLDDTVKGPPFSGTIDQTRFSFTGLIGGNHTVYIKDANGCTAEWLVSLDLAVRLVSNVNIVYGCDNNSPSNSVTVTLEGDSSVASGSVDFALDNLPPFQPSNVFPNVAPGPHTITVRHSNTCEKKTRSFEILKFDKLELTLSNGELNEIVATATGGAGNYEYTFDSKVRYDTNNKYIYYKSGDYTVTVRDANGCEATAIRYFEFIDIIIPNVFTPNGDTNNDGWSPINTINYKDLTVTIFDRYGRKVATLREGQTWDGRYNQQELPTGDYWYVLKLKNVQDGREFVGHFTLMR